MIRIGYLFPEAEINRGDGFLDLVLPEHLDFDDIKKQLLYAIYREKIREEGRDSRQSLNIAVFGQ
ncbi:hypothetical protein [uncultured Roseibium sp.]|uniref:hypothetical protein n=1 Tax=uncultured Roseibium sp. TaxID=1936171 RepID=UPI00261DCC5C|nr:hypothetical protein [uncultured Roseibium sp.]